MVIRNGSLRLQATVTRRTFDQLDQMEKIYGLSTSALLIRAINTEYHNIHIYPEQIDPPTSKGFNREKAIAREQTAHEEQRRKFKGKYGMEPVDNEYFIMY